MLIYKLNLRKKHKCIIIVVSSLLQSAKTKSMGKLFFFTRQRPCLCCSWRMRDERPCCSTTTTKPKQTAR